MATTVNSGFNNLLSNVRASSVETKAAASHRASIYQKLKNEFGATAFFRSGSFGSGTNISGYSDVDYFCVIPRTNLKQNSAFTLSHVAEALRDRFPLTTGIRVNGPAVQLPFGLDGAEATEVVPVNATGRTFLDFRKFEMPNAKGGWMFSAPESHNAYVKQIDDGLGYMVKPLIRFIKAWKYFRSVPISSFYLEIRTAEYASNESNIVYDIDVLSVMQRFQSELLLPFPDPRFPNENRYINACNTEVQRQTALSEVDRAVQRAEAAVSANRKGNVAQAFERWNLFYNNQFPMFTSA